MKLGYPLNRLRATLRGRKPDTGSKRLKRSSLANGARLSDRMLKDIGYRRDGAWIGRDIDY